MSSTMQVCFRRFSMFLLAGGGFLFASLSTPHSAHAQNQASRPRRVKAYVQSRPGGPRKEVRMRIHPSPVDLPIVKPADAHLADDDLVLGVQVGDRVMAYPIRYLALYEVVNSRVGKSPIAATW